MSTRCNILVKDSFDDRIQIYRHSDGYPEGPHGVIAGLKEALPYAWELPRFEATEFAAAIVAAWKKVVSGSSWQGGYIYIDGSLRVAEDDSAMAHADIEWFYVIRQDGASKKLMVDVYKVSWGKGFETPVRSLEIGEDWVEEETEGEDELPM